MAQVIDFGHALCARMKPDSSSPKAIPAKLSPPASPAADQPSVAKENLYRAILLLDLAAQQTRSLLRKITDQSRKSTFEAQITTIEESIQHARDLTLKL